MSLRYQHTQIGTVTVVAFGVIVLIMLLVGIGTGDLRHLLILPPLLGIGAVFARLTIRIDHRTLQASFGWGWPRKQVPLDRIESARVVRNPWYYGYGIHLTPRGVLYNTSGSGGVEVRLRSGKRFRLGSDQPEALCRAIEEAIGRPGA